MVERSSKRSSRNAVGPGTRRRGEYESTRYRGPGNRLDQTFCWSSDPASQNQLKRYRLVVASGSSSEILRRHDFCQLIHGVDVAENAIESARKTAEAERLDGLTYEVADLNTVQVPGRDL